jgi:formylglycine-generating enzyme required for sulfatase activity
VGHAPNPWGLYDMLGNVSERCHDLYQEDYPAGPVTDPVGEAAIPYRAQRGGGYWSWAEDCRAANREGVETVFAYKNTGFRPVRTLP